MRVRAGRRGFRHSTHRNRPSLAKADRWRGDHRAAQPKRGRRRRGHDHRCVLPRRQRPPGFFRPGTGPVAEALGADIHYLITGQPDPLPTSWPTATTATTRPNLPHPVRPPRCGKRFCCRLAAPHRADAPHRMGLGHSLHPCRYCLGPGRVHHSIGHPADRLENLCACNKPMWISSPRVRCCLTPRHGCSRFPSKIWRATSPAPRQRSTLSSWLTLSA